MSTHPVIAIYPTRIDWDRFCKNGQPVNGTFERLLHDQMNHIVSCRRKNVLFKPCTYSEIPAPTSGTQTWHSFAFHAGHGAQYVEAQIAVALAMDGSATDPYVDMQVADGISGGTTVTSNEFHYGLNTNSGISDTIDEWAWGRLYIPVTSDTFYRGWIRGHDFARVAQVLVHEVAFPEPVDTADGAIDPRIGPGSAILDGDLKTLNEGLTDIWRHNAGTVFAWTSKYGDTYTHSGTTYTNPFDSTTSVSSSSLGVNVDLQYHNTVSQSTVPVKMVVRAVRTAGAGSTANNKVRITDGTNHIEITGIDNSTGWYQTTGTMPATNGQKVDVQMYSNGTDTLRLDAISVFEYQA